MMFDEKYSSNKRPVLSLASWLQYGANCLYSISLRELVSNLFKKRSSVTALAKVLVS